MRELSQREKKTNKISYNGIRSEVRKVIDKNGDLGFDPHLRKEHYGSPHNMTSIRDMFAEFQAEDT